MLTKATLHQGVLMSNAVRLTMQGARKTAHEETGSFCPLLGRQDVAAPVILGTAMAC